MVKQLYQSLFSKINPPKSSKELLKIEMQEEFNKMHSNLDKNQTKSTFHYKYVALAATFLFTTIVALQYTKYNPISEVPSPPISMETPMQDNTILYSTLKFAKLMKIDVPNLINEMPGKIAPFTEELLSESDLVIKGTILNISFTEQKDPGSDLVNRQSVVYEVRLDKVYHSESSYKEGDTIIIENDLYTYTSLEGSVGMLNANRQYILSLKEEEGQVSIIYPFSPQIEITEDGKYLFPDHWTSLLSENTMEVTMDVDEVLPFSGQMKVRTDSAFETDFQQLVDTFLN